MSDPFPNRPESWKAKMPLSGKPLITDAQFERLLANAPASRAEMEDHDPVPVVKIFLPHIRWIIGWIYRHNLDLCRCVVMLGRKPPEMGDAWLSDIVNSRLGSGSGGVKPERDKYITLDQPLSYYLENPDCW
jgi:hypothetical protein